MSMNVDILIRVVSNQVSEALSNITGMFTNLASKVTNFSLGFEQTMRNVNTIAKVTEDQFKSMTDEIRKLSEDPLIKDGPTSLAQGMYTLVSSGFETAEAMKIAGVASKAAAGGASDAATAISTLSGIMNAYSQRTLPDAIKYSDQLFKIIELGIYDFNTLSRSMGQVLSVVDSTKVAFEDIGAMYVEQSKNAISAGMAQISTLSVIREFIKPSQQAVKVLKEYGLEMSTASLQSKGLAGSIQEMYEKVGRNKEVMLQIFGKKEQQRAILGVLKNDMKDYLSDVEKIKNSQGSTDDAVKEQLKSTQAQLDKLYSSLENMLIGFGQNVLNAMKPVITVLNAVIELINLIDDSTKKMIVSTATWIVSIGILSGVLIGITSLIGGSLVSVLVLFNTTIIASILQVGLFATVTDVLVISVIALSNALRVIILFLTPLNIGILAIVGAIAAWHSIVVMLQGVNESTLSGFSGWLQYLDPVRLLGVGFQKIADAIKDIGVFAKAAKDQEDKEKEKKEAQDTIDALENQAKAIENLRYKYGDLDKAKKELSKLSGEEANLFSKGMQDFNRINKRSMTNEERNSFRENTQQKVYKNPVDLQKKKDFENLELMSSDDYLKLKNAKILMSQYATKGEASQRYKKEAEKYGNEQERRAKEEEANKLGEVYKDPSDDVLRKKEQLKYLREKEFTNKLLTITKDREKALSELAKKNFDEQTHIEEMFTGKSKEELARKNTALKILETNYGLEKLEIKKKFDEKEKDEREKKAEKEKRDQEKIQKDLLKHYNKLLDINKGKIDLLDSKKESGQISQPQYEKSMNPIIKQRKGYYQDLISGKESKKIDQDTKDTFIGDLDKFNNELVTKKIKIKEKLNQQDYEMYLNSIKRVKDENTFKADNELEKIALYKDSLNKKENIDLDYFQKVLAREKKLKLDKNGINIEAIDEEINANNNLLKTLTPFDEKRKDIIQKNIDLERERNKLVMSFLIEEKKLEEAQSNEWIALNDKISQIKIREIDFDIQQAKLKVARGEKTEQSLYDFVVQKTNEKIQQYNLDLEANKDNQVKIAEINKSITAEQNVLTDLKIQKDEKEYKLKLDVFTRIKNNADVAFKSQKIGADKLYEINQNIRKAELKALEEKTVASDKQSEHEIEIQRKKNEITIAFIDEEERKRTSLFNGLNQIGDLIGQFDNKTGNAVKSLASFGNTIVNIVKSGGQDVGAWLSLVTQAISGIVYVFEVQKNQAEKFLNDTKELNNELMSVSNNIAQTNAQINSNLDNLLNASAEKFKKQRVDTTNEIDKSIKDYQKQIEQLRNGFNIDNIIGFMFDKENWAERTKNTYENLTNAIEMKQKEKGITSNQQTELEYKEKTKITSDYYAKIEKLEIDYTKNEQERKQKQLDFDLKKAKESLDLGDMQQDEYNKIVRNKTEDFNDWVKSKDIELQKLKISLQEQYLDKLDQTYKLEIQLLEEKNRQGYIKEEEYQTRLAILKKSFQTDLLDQLNKLVSEKDRLANKLMEQELKPITSKAEIEIENIRRKMRPVEAQVRALDEQLRKIDEAYARLEKTANKDSSAEFARLRQARLKDIEANYQGFYGRSEDAFNIDQDAKREQIESDFLNGLTTEAERVKKLMALQVDGNIFYSKITRDIKTSQGATQMYFDYVKRGNQAYADFNSLYKENTSIKAKNERDILEDQKKGLTDILDQNESNIKTIEEKMTESIDRITLSFKDSAGQFSNELISKMTGKGGAFDIILEQWRKVDQEINATKAKVESTLSSNQKLAQSADKGYVMSTGTSSSNADNTPKSGETYDQMIARFKKEDAEKAKAASSKTVTSNNSSPILTAAITAGNVAKTQQTASKPVVNNVPKENSLTYSGSSYDYTKPTIIKGINYGFLNNSSTSWNRVEQEKFEQNIINPKKAETKQTGTFDKGGSLGFLNPLNWFDTGGLVKNKSIVGVAETGAERILSPRQTTAFEKLVESITNPSFKTSNFGGGTNVYVNITGNTISSEMDLNRISSKISKDVMAKMTENYVSTG